MATKGDFTEQEWTQLQQGIMGTTLLVSTSDPKFFDTFKEAGAAAHLLAAARKGDASQLVRELSESRPKGFGVTTSPQQLETEATAALHAAVSALEQKAPDELEAYRKFVLEVAQSVAEAAGGGVAPAETGAIGKVKAALQTS